MLEKIASKLSPTSKATFYLTSFGITKVPMIFYLTPRVTEFSEQKCTIKIPLSFRAKNHLGSMYFGALCTGADCAGGLLAMRLIHESGNKVSLVFKDFKAEFLKRAEADVYFRCTQGNEIKELVSKALNSEERQNMTVHVEAFTQPPKSDQTVVAKFELTLSLKKTKSSKSTKSK